MDNVDSDGDELEVLPPDLSPRPYWRPEPAPTHSDWRLALHSDTDKRVVSGGILVVAFAGLGVSDKPSYEFETILKLYPRTHQLFLRDSNLQWYVPNRAWFASVIRAASEASGATKLVFLGASAGGWGALLLQALFFPEAHVAAFSPQAFLDTATRVNEEDDRWAPYINHLNKSTCSGTVNEGTSNGVASSPLNLLQDSSLAVVEPSSQGPPPRLEVHYNINHYLDARHATYLRRLSFKPAKECESTPPRLRVRCVPQDGPHGDEAHALAKHLRNQGDLVHILDAFILGSDSRNSGISTSSINQTTKIAAVPSLLPSSSDSNADHRSVDTDSGNGIKYDTTTQEVSPCAEETPLFDYEDVNGVLVPRFDLDLLRTALRSSSTVDSDSSACKKPCLRPALPDATLTAARYALSEVGFFLLKPSTDELSTNNHTKSPSFPRATEQRVADCYAQCAAMASMPLTQKQDRWSLEAAREQGLLGGWRRGESDLIYCDSFRCAVEELPTSLERVNESSEEGLDVPATVANDAMPTTAPSAADVTAAAMSGRGGCLGKRHLWPDPHVLPGFRDALHGYAQALSGDAGLAVLGLLEEALCLPREYISNKCSPGNALSYLTTRVYPPASPDDDSAAGTLGMRMQ